MTKKKSILIVAIIAVLVVAISGVSFAAWQAFVKPADQTWVVTANNPDQLKVNTQTPTPGNNYNGESGVATDTAYTTSCKFNVTSNIAMTMSVGVLITVDYAGGDVRYEAITEGASPTETHTDASLSANVAKDVTVTVTFPNYSDPKYYGANFMVVIILGKATV